jgi:two-component system, LytTR family, response regulator
MIQPPIQVIITDDDINARNSLKKLLSENFPHVQVVAEAGDVVSAVKLIHQHKPDLIFLDIDMPGHSGIELPEFFDKDQIYFKIVFITAFSEFAINAFELSAIDYILKPPSVEHLARALSKLTPTPQNHYQVLRDNMQDTSNQKIALQTAKSMLFIHLNDIINLKADGSYTHIVLADGSVHMTSKKLSEYSRLENTGFFMRIHRSHIINLNHIIKIEKGESQSVVLTNGLIIPIANERKKTLFSYLENFKF